MAARREYAAKLDELHEDIERALRLPVSADRSALLARLHTEEAECWRQVFESSQSRLSWLAAAAASERARGLAERWSNAEVAASQDSGWLRPVRGRAAA